MTAADILAHWEPVARIFSHHPSAWLRLVKLCAANGPVPVKTFRHHGQVAAHDQDVANLIVFRRWQKAGLVTITDSPAPRRNGLPRKLIEATPKAYALLRLDP